MLPASPPSPPSDGWASAADDPSSWNLIDGFTRCSAPTNWGLPMRDMPATLDHSVEASSATAAPPAKALPRPEAEFSLSWNPAASASAGPTNPVKAMTAWASCVGTKDLLMMNQRLPIAMCDDRMDTVAAPVIALPQDQLGSVGATPLPPME